MMRFVIQARIATGSCSVLRDIVEFHSISFWSNLMFPTCKAVDD